MRGDAWLAAGTGGRGAGPYRSRLLFARGPRRTGENVPGAAAANPGLRVVAGGVISSIRVASGDLAFPAACQETPRAAGDPVCQAAAPQMSAMFAMNSAAHVSAKTLRYAFKARSGSVRGDFEIFAKPSGSLCSLAHMIGPRLFRWEKMAPVTQITPLQGRGAPALPPPDLPGQAKLEAEWCRQTTVVVACVVS